MNFKVLIFFIKRFSNENTNNQTEVKKTEKLIVAEFH